MVYVIERRNGLKDKNVPFLVIDDRSSDRLANKPIDATYQPTDQPREGHEGS